MLYVAQSGMQLDIGSGGMNGRKAYIASEVLLFLKNGLVSIEFRSKFLDVLCDNFRIGLYAAETSITNEYAYYFPFTEIRLTVYRSAAPRE